MKSNPSNENRPTAYDARIDAALHRYGRALPEPGLESRVAARMAVLPRHSSPSGPVGSAARRWLMLLRGASVGALAAAAACAIVVGTLKHSQHLPIPQASVGTRSGSVGAATGSHIPTHTIPQTATLDPESPRPAPRSRSTVSRNPGNKAGAVPSSPYPPGQEPSSKPQQ
jgi:hypothetical protein